MARNEITIDWPKVDSLLKAQCDGTGIAAMLGIHPNTLYRKCEEKHEMSFSDYSALKRGEGKELLRAKMFDAAMKGDKVMQIWLSKQYLDMREKLHSQGEQEVEIRIVDETDNNNTSEAAQESKVNT